MYILLYNTISRRPAWHLVTCNIERLGVRSYLRIERLGVRSYLRIERLGVRSYLRIRNRYNLFDNLLIIVLNTPPPPPLPPLHPSLRHACGRIGLHVEHKQWFNDFHYALYTHRWIVPPLHPLSHLSYRPSVVTLRNGYRDAHIDHYVYVQGCRGIRWNHTYSR